MGVALSLKLDHTSKEVQQALAKLEKADEIHEAIEQATNDTGKWTRDQILRGTGKRLGLPKAVQRLKKRTRYRKARDHRGKFVGDVWLLPIAVHDFMTDTQLTDSPAKRKRARKAGGIKARGSLYPKAFRATADNGKKLLIKRKGKSPYPTTTINYKATPTVVLQAAKEVKPKVKKRYLGMIRRRVRYMLYKLNR